MNIIQCSTFHPLNPAAGKVRFRIFGICSPTVRFISHGISNSRRFCGVRVACTESDSAIRSSSPELAILMEVDGVLMDVHRLTNRQSFNTAFSNRGLDCAKWTEPVYQDLYRRGGGNDEKMLFLYFDQIGWPASLPTSEKDLFVNSLSREKKTTSDQIVISEALSLRPGVEKFIDDAVNDGIPVAVLTAYGKVKERIARSIVEKLGKKRVSRIKIIGKKEVEQSMYGRVVVGNSFSDETLAQEALKSVSEKKQRIAEEVASLSKVKVELSGGLTETALQSIVAAQRAAAECADVAVGKCVLVAGNQNGLAATQRIGMPCVVVRCSLTARAEFPAAKAVFDGFGESELTVSRLLTKL